VSGSTYLDSQTISPGASFSYEIEFGGSGNRNLSPGDSIFHCHLYPHFAQGMWELWRVHDVFEDGGEKRRLPDAEIKEGTENPALVPLPGNVLALMPTEEFKGYPFYVAGEAGHRPPQPPLDFGVTGKTTADGKTDYVDGGLQRHILTGWEDQGTTTQRALANQDVMEAALSKGSTPAQINARRVFKKNSNALYALAEEWHEIGTKGIKFLPPEGDPKEKAAMAFHAGTLNTAGFVPVAPATPAHPGWQQENKAYKSQWAATVPGQTAPVGPATFAVNGRKEIAGAPYADPCPKNAPLRKYKAGVIQTELTVNRHGWFDPQARILALEQDIKDIVDPTTRDRLPEPLFFRANSGDCIQFEHSNFVPNALALDDFQIYTPTDTIGQHIHLVKFDVTSSDGSGNGYNYEDGTYSPEEVQERLHAINAARKKAREKGEKDENGKDFLPLPLKTHPLFLTACADKDERCEKWKSKGLCPENAHLLSLKELAKQAPLCGAQRTVQRWYADPIFDAKVAPGYKNTGRDYTLRTVFTHDHFGASSHQQHGLYGALIVEPSNSVWLALDQNTFSVDDWAHLCSSDTTLRAAARGKIIGGANLSAVFDGECGRRAVPTAVAANELREPLKLRDDGGPTASRANIISPMCLSGVPNGGSLKNSNPLDPRWTAAKTQCPPEQRAPDTRREYALAMADFAVLYNTALEPINPEQRDLSALRFGRRQVPINTPMPLAISSEDPGTQLINYRNEPIPLRVADRTPDPVAGGFNYTQKKCPNGVANCSSDMSNVFSTEAHKRRDMTLATTNYGAIFSPTDAALLATTPVGPSITAALSSIEGWRRDFNCALYPSAELSDNCRKDIKRLEPWRVMGDPATPILPVYEGDPMYVRLIQGAQEAQHVFASTGHYWRREPDKPNSGFVSAQSLGISEHFEFDIKPSPLAIKRYDSLYMGSSVDQLWDGMWGLVRSFGVLQTVTQSGELVISRPAYDGVAQLYSVRGNPVPVPAVPISGGDVRSQVCNSIDPRYPTQTTYHRRLHFDISAVRACELTGTCDKAGRKGITYNQRLSLDDPNAIVYVRNNKLPGEAEPGTNANAVLSNSAVLTKLKQQFEQKQRRIEPLVLRAPAGACMEVTLRNHLPVDLKDGEIKEAGNDSTAHYSDNFMSMILDGFNYNQLRMSSVIGLSAPMVARYALDGDGANFGINSAESNSGESASQDGPGTGVGAGARRPPPAARPPDLTGSPQPVNQPPVVRRQSSLVPPCPADSALDLACKSKPMLWYAGEYALDSQGKQRHKPIEFGVLPLSSFADVVKHPAHGAIGALVIGPEGSVVPAFSDDPAKYDRLSETSAKVTLPSGKYYRDFVMVLQDAVDAKIKGDLVPNLKGAEEPDDYGIKAVNYRSEPLWGRRGGDPSIDFEERNEFDYAGVLSSKLVGKGAKAPCQAGITKLAQDLRGPCEAETPIFVTRAGEEVRMRVVHPGGHTRQQAITLHGHDWNPAPWTRNSQALLPTHNAAIKHAWNVQGSYNAVGPMMSANLLLTAGGRWQVPMDYLWRSQASFVYDGGIWGLMRVLPSQQPRSGIARKSKLGANLSRAGTSISLAGAPAVSTQVR
jgi:manganese oxidase